MKKHLCALVLCSSLFASNPDCDWGIPSHATAKYRFDKGIGYEDGYATLEGFLTPSWDRDIQPYIDARGHIFNNGKWATNLGAGSRFNLPSTWVIGGNFFWDYRDVDLLNSVNQLSAGFEAFHKYFDFRMSGYYPVGRPRKSIKTATKIKMATALPSIFGSLGFPIPTWDFLELYFALGPYYLVERTKSDIDCGGSFGGFARLEAKVYDGITLGIDTTFDGTFHGIVQGYLAISFPFGPAQLIKGGKRWNSWFQSASCKNEAGIRRRMQSDVWHNEIIPVCTGSKKR